MPNHPYNIALIGYGFSAKVFHIPLIAAVPDFQLYAIVQRSPTPDDNAEKDHPGVKGYTSSEEMVRDPHVHVVVVTSTPSSHFDLTRLALEHGKHGRGCPKTECKQLLRDADTAQWWWRSRSRPRIKRRTN